MFYYFGDDEAYFKALQGEFKKNSRFPVEFKRFFETEESRIQTLFVKIFKEKPACVFIDFSKHTQDYLHLARIITRTSLEHKIATVGLVDYLSPPEILKESIATGVDLTHIKSAETFDVVFDIQKILTDDASHGFATCSLIEEWEAGVPSKIGYITQNGLHFETDFKLTKGSKIRLHHHWMDRKLVPSSQVFVKEISSSNLFYQFKFNTDVDFLFVDEYIPAAGLSADEVKEKQNEREEMIHYHQKHLKKWLDDNLSLSLEKRAKVLVVDRTFPLYQNQARTDKHPYTIRSIPFFTEIADDINRMRPQVIAYSFDAEDVAEKKNTIEDLEKMVNVLKAKFADTNPFIVVFNSKIPSKELQEKLKHAQTMSYDGELSVEVLVRMADIFEKKMGAAVVQAKGNDKVFIKKNNPASVAEILIPIKIVKLSETDMIFQTDAPVEVGMNIHIHSPVDMYINIRPVKTQGKIPEYHGLIHGLGETDKKELRRFVNTIFFRDHDAQLSAESDEFKRLNEAKLQEKIDILKAQADAKANSEPEEIVELTPGAKGEK